MLRKLIIVLSLFSTTSIVAANNLTQAYQKEFTFLKAQKNELSRRVSTETAESKQAQNRAHARVDALQEKLLDLTIRVQDSQQQLEDMRESLTDVQDNSEMTTGVLMQMKSSLTPYGRELDENESTPNSQKLRDGFLAAAELYRSLSSKMTAPGSFFLPDGTKAEGEIVKLGNISAFGVSAKGSGALAPAGAGEFKLWKQPGSAATATALANNERPDELTLFIYENSNMEVPDPEPKTLMSTVHSGGIIGYIILVLGAFGFFLVLFRVVFLITANSNVSKITDIVVGKIEACKADEAITAIKDFKGSIARVVKSILRNIKHDREHLEDIITESILNESAALDRFGSFILVIAAVAPLLGLLGTVSGMISTFDVITEFGTGDPKLLAGGISVALVTTMLGLIIAIPLLLIGNLLSGWSQNIKDAMERNALHIVNQYEKNRRRCIREGKQIT